MPKWVHVLLGPNEHGELVNVYTQPTALNKQEFRAKLDPDDLVHIDDDGNVHQIEYIGAGRGDWWQRTTNPHDKLCMPFKDFLFGRYQAEKRDLP